MRFLIIFCYTVVFISCKNFSGRSSIDSEILKRNNVFIQNSILKSFAVLDKNVHDPVSRETAIFWSKKALAIDSNFKALNQMLDSSSLKFGIENFVNDYKKNYKNLELSINLIFNDSLNSYKFHNAFDEFFESENEINQKILNEFGDKELEPVIFFEMIKNKNLLLQEKLIDYCLKHSIASVFIYDSFTIFTSMNSIHFKPNDKLVLKTGLGAMKSDGIIEFFVDNKKLNNQNPEGVFEYSLIVKGKKGKNNFPIKVIYRNPLSNSIDSLTQDIEYIID